MQFAAIFYVPDVAASLRFYEQAFGLKPRFLSDTGLYGDIEMAGGAMLGFASRDVARDNWPGGVRDTDPNGAPPAFEVGFSFDDVAAALDRALAAGATPLAKPTLKPWGQTVAFVRDLNGHVVELSSPWAPPA